MTISYSTGLSTGSALHGSMNVAAWEYSRTVQSFFGLTGEVQLQGRMHGREMTAWTLPFGYSTHALLMSAIETVNSNIGQFGTLTWAVGADSKTFTNTVFNGLDLQEDPWLDGSGVNGWQVLCTLKFRQIKS